MALRAMCKYYTLLTSEVSGNDDIVLEVSEDDGVESKVSENGQNAIGEW